ncbi:hypothetical protein [Winslowiella arboricola]|uniref:hypothetical protein n=1 Tax=Winslowiella arboricola TaxID=2978220 RepID=UPI00225DD077|nr:hypothetical protein [Winslowiella arboricola]MCU5775191.1 hypothetical protein [Winslowiella arboricola]
MAKSPAERKADQRARQAAASEFRIEVVLDAQELEMLDHDCVARRPGRDPYDRSELLALMIRKYHGELLAQIEEMKKRQCGKCKEALPVQDCCCKTEEACWVNLGWHEVKLTT